jgi:hypothetical protein
MTEKIYANFAYNAIKQTERDGINFPLDGSNWHRKEPKVFMR